jgi:hypothetical protein
LLAFAAVFASALGVVGCGETADTETLRPDEAGQMMQAPPASGAEAPDDRAARENQMGGSANPNAQGGTDSTQ